MNHDSAAAPPRSPAAGATRGHRDFERDVSETRGEFRTLKWAAALAFLAIVGTMGFFYSALERFHESQKDIRETLGAIHKQTELLSEHLFDQDERLDRMDGHVQALVKGLVEVNARLDQVVARLDQMDGRMHKVERGLQQVNGRLDRMDGRQEQMDARLGSMEDLLRVLAARSAEPS